MLPHNINVNNAMIQQQVECCECDTLDVDDMCHQSCVCCETTSEHDVQVAKMIDLSSRGFNTLCAVFDKSSNTLTRKSDEHLEPYASLNRTLQFRCILIEYANNDTQHRTV